MSEDTRFPREGKKYALKSSAIRAARQDGLVDGQYTIHEHPQKNGKNSDWSYKINDSHRAVAEQLAPQIEKKQEEAKKLEEKPSPTGKKAKPIPVDDDIPRKPLRVVEYGTPEYEEHLKEEAAEKAVPTESVNTKNLSVVKSATSDTPNRIVKEIPGYKRDPNKLHKSQVESPTKLVWHIADEMTSKDPTTTRKQVIEECQKRGIAFYTARTQYQQWITTKRESDANAAKVNLKRKK